MASVQCVSVCAVVVSYVRQFFKRFRTSLATTSIKPAMKSTASLFTPPAARPSSSVAKATAAPRPFDSNSKIISAPRWPM